MKLSPLRHTAFALALLALGAQPALALPFNFSGTFAQDDDVQFFTFTLTGASSISIDTTSYAGGGFVPAVTVWNSAGTFQTSAAGSASDVTMNFNLNLAGTYWMALSEDPNLANGNDLVFIGGEPTTSIFQYDGQGNFTGAFSGANYCSTDQTDGFYMQGTTDCVKRTNAWALSITGEASLTDADPYPNTSVPEPATLALTLTGLAGCIPFARRRSIDQA